MKKIILFLGILPFLSTLADVSVDVPSRRIQILNEKGFPVKNAIIEYSIFYEKCYKFYFGTGNPCKQKAFINQQFQTNKEGWLSIPAVKKSKSNGFNSEYKDLSLSISYIGIDVKEIVENFQGCGFSLNNHLTTKPISQNLANFQEENNIKSSCFYYMENNNSITKIITGDIRCELTGIREVLQDNGVYKWVKIPLQDGIEDYKKFCQQY